MSSHYNSIYGFKAIECVGIIIIHVQSNTGYEHKENLIFDIFISSLTWLVWLFLMISGFGLSAGYLMNL